MKANFLILTFFSLLIFYNANAQWTIKNLKEDSWKTGIVKFNNNSLGFSLGTGSSFFKTEDVGETWQQKELNINVNIKDFQFIGNSSVFAVGDYYTGSGENLTSKLIKSDNLGDTWDLIANFPGKQLHTLHFFDNNSGIVAGFDEIYRTINSGDTWNTVWSIKENGYKYGEIAQISFYKQIGYAVGQGRNQNNDGPNFDYFLLKSNDAGLTWNKIRSFPSPLTSIHFINENSGFIGTGASIIYKTIDGGVTWTETEITNNRNSILSIQFISDLVGFATGHPSAFIPEGPTSFFISKTIDGGETWTSYERIGIPLTSIHFLNNAVGFVAGHYNLIMKTNGTIDKLPEDYPWHLITEPNSINEHKLYNSQFEIYPNPTSGILFVQNLNPTKKIKKINIINNSGQIVGAKNPISNNETMQLDLSDLASGIYFMKVEYSDKTRVMKIIKK